jgi:glyceraldehyde-3-phosphate dehydrogenase/erythrose-4-phosphate dehydrogenase
MIWLQGLRKITEHLTPEIRIQIRQVTQDPAVAILSPRKNKSKIFLMRIKDTATLVWTCTAVYTHCDSGYCLQHTATLVWTCTAVYTHWDSGYCLQQQQSSAMSISELWATKNHKKRVFPQNFQHNRWFVTRHNLFSVTSCTTTSFARCSYLAVCQDQGSTQCMCTIIQACSNTT